MPGITQWRRNTLKKKSRATSTDTAARMLRAGRTALTSVYLRPVKPATSDSLLVARPKRSYQ